MNLSCIIVDDEPLAIKLLENFVERTPYLTLQASYTDSVQALSELRENPCNLIFLDIQMPDLDGMELSRMVPAETRIIFTTAFKQYAFDSYEVNALDFLLKPIRYNKFLAAAEKAKEWFGMKENATSNKPSSIYIKADGELRQINLEKILYVQGMKDYVIFQMENEKYITHLTMTAVENLLDSSHFMRIHRSYIIAPDKIKSIDKNNCVYIGNEIIHVTDAYLEKFNEYLNSKIAK